MNSPITDEEQKSALSSLVEIFQQDHLVKTSGIGATEIAKQMNIGRATVYKILNEEKAHA